MMKRALLIFLLVGLTALSGCHTGASTSVRADYYGAYGYGGRDAPYYYYNPYYYPAYFYDPYPSYFFGTSFIYGYPYFYPQSFIIVDHRHRGIPPGSRSLRGFRGAPRDRDGTTSRMPSGGGTGGSGGGRSLR